MIYEPTIIAESTRQIITREEAKLQCNVQSTAWDPLFDIYIAAATDYVEAHTGRTFYEKTLEVALDYWPGWNYIELPRATPLLEIVSVNYTDGDGNPAAFASYFADVDPRPGRLVLNYNESWPSATLKPASAIRIRYKAGLSDSASPLVEVGGHVKYPILLLVAAMYENREAEVITDRAAIQAVSMTVSGFNNFISRLRVHPTCY